ncbi:MAG: NAD(P)-dependent oxidoreductase [Oscillibacter sp.]|nr:NAD(P)-dependent oxidoreductase [Oscillibacter sp.]MEA4993172.1 NAD(P)-dependent oxidoreductase [Oscillibacter sp.]
MKKVIITGVTGFIGGALAKTLLEQGCKVCGIGRSADRLAALSHNSNFVPVVASLGDYQRLSTLIPADQYDCFFHFAWDGVFGEAFKNYSLQLSNANACCEALIQAKKMGCKKFVLAGTYNEYEIQSFMKSEEFSPRFTCIYSSSKMVAELICKTLAFQYGIEYSAGLICMAYGEHNPSNMIANIVLRQLNQGVEPKLIEGNNYYDMIYIDDIVRAFIAIAENGKNLKSYYMGHRKLQTFRELFTNIRNIIAPDVGLHFGAFQDTANMDYSTIDLDALYRDTGFECHADFKESILKTAQWLKEIEGN